MTPKFSIITPTWNRADGRLQRCLTSVQAQTFKDFEHIVVDDGSTDDTEKIMKLWGLANGSLRVRYIRIEHQGRVVARNVGMEAATGDWVAWLDSDDSFDPEYLATFDHHIQQTPEARLWVCGSRYHGMIKSESGKHLVPKWTKLRAAWMPPVDTDGVHSHFPSGRIGSGMFVYARECIEKTGLFPPWKNHNEISDGADEFLGYETGYSAAKRWIGNPWGDDWVFFRKLTLFYRVHLIPACLYNQYVR